MLQALLSALGGAPTLKQAAEDFREMTELARDMARTATGLFWAADPDPKTVRMLQERDDRMDELQSSVRRAALKHLSGGEPADVPYSLLLMSLVKDVERIGDYALNLASVSTWVGQGAPSLPDDEIVAELRGLSGTIDALAAAAPEVYEGDEPERARKLVEAGQARGKVFDQLIGRIAASTYGAATASQLTLAVRFLKRIDGHFMNLLSSMVVPLDQLDHFDEPELLSF